MMMVREVEGGDEEDRGGEREESKEGYKMCN